ncbi:hypothetical protein DENSPDRAFT_883057 [Dentipellis sp. KUC8613]|nr:hypothetical protein DENSPDRAFT_883057 [Dentipellis sp. KUC8613]
MPPELLRKIFNELDPVFVATLQRVCHRWRLVIRHDFILQHEAACLRNGLRRGVPQLLDIGERLKIVLHHETAWATLPKYSRNEAFPHAQGSPDEVTVKASENVIVEMTKGGFQFSYFISGRLRDRGTKSPSSLKHEWEHGSMDIDSSQDLFAWVEYDDGSPHNHGRLVMKVFFKDFRRGCNHGQAFTGKYFAYTMPRDSTVIFSKLVIAGDFIAVGSMTEDERRVDRSRSPLIVFNWKTGSIILNLYDTWLFDFCFLDEQHLLFYARGFRDDTNVSNQDVLLVYNLKTHGPQFTSIKAATYVCGFSMPATTMRGTNYPSLRTSVPLPSLLANSLVNIHISNGNYGLRGMTVIGYIDILFHASSMRRWVAACARGQPRIFNWKEWGTVFTQTTSTVSRDKHVDCNFLTGMRAVDLRTDRNQQLWLYIRDFDRSRVALAKAQGGSNVQESTTVEAKSWSRERITTRLPCLVREIRLAKVPGLEDMDTRYTHCTVTEDGVIIYDLRRRCPIRVMYL